MKLSNTDSFTLEELLSGWRIVLQKNKTAKARRFSAEEAEVLGQLLFAIPQEYRPWILKKGDEKAVIEFIRHREAQKHGIPLIMGSRHLRKMHFWQEYIACRFNAAEAARRCGYVGKYARQIGYQARRRAPLSDILSYTLQ